VIESKSILEYTFELGVSKFGEEYFSKKQGLKKIYFFVDIYEGVV
jgi:hypothetical protein